MTTTRLSKADIESLPNFRRKTNREWCAACPECGTGDDRFLFWPDKGNYYCRQCELKGFILETDQATFSPEQREAWRRAQLQRERNEAETEARMLAEVAKLEPVVERYHSQLAGANGYWKHCGLEPETVNRYRLGYCKSCPTYPACPSYVIPVYQSKKLVAIRHRLTCPPTPGDKYRYHMAGMKAQLFNAGTLRSNSNEVPFGILEPGEALLVEGEVKAMFLDQMGFTVAGVPGAAIWKEKWGRFFEDIRTVFIAFDPGANGAAEQTARQLSGIVHQVCIVTLPNKPDDLFVKYGCGLGEFVSMLEQGRVVR